MNLTEMYLNSPDWLKLIWIISPYLTLYALGRIWAKHWVKPVPKAEVEELQWVEVATQGTALVVPANTDEETQNMM